MPAALIVSASLDPSGLHFLPNKLSLNSLLPCILYKFPVPSCYDMLSFSNTVAHQISVAALAACGRREPLMCPTMLKHFLGNEGVRWGASALNFTV
ncbi:hypothetical protein M405DRAFT_834945 [Rhizopogon salebrosus TDB-379]|nr:hypothetical protein M405DRAFT_834945 [Rhizopogon salebrosus TDB-379]